VAHIACNGAGKSSRMPMLADIEGSTTAPVDAARPSNCPGITGSAINFLQRLSRKLRQRRLIRRGGLGLALAYMLLVVVLCPTQKNPDSSRRRPESLIP
jgi:hypothetical protein